MTSSELNALVSALYVYKDDGSGEFEVGSDEVALDFGGPIDLVDGAPAVGPLTDPDAAWSFGEAATFFVVLEFKPTAGQQAVTRMTVNHLPEISLGTGVRDTPFDIPQVVETEAGSSALFEVVETLPQCLDGSDNDFDGEIDFPDDPECPNALWDDESTGPPPPKKPAACGLGPDLALLLPALMWLRRRARRGRA